MGCSDSAKARFFPEVSSVGAQIDTVAVSRKDYEVSIDLRAEVERLQKLCAKYVDDWSTSQAENSKLAEHAVLQGAQLAVAQMRIETLEADLRQALDLSDRIQKRNEELAAALLLAPRYTA